MEPEITISKGQGVVEGNNKENEKEEKEGSESIWKVIAC